MLKEQLNILNLYKKDLNQELTFKQIKEKTKQKSNNQVQTALKYLQEKQILNKKLIGNVALYFINLSTLTIAYLNLINELEIDKSKATEKSDLDIAIITQTKEIIPSLETIKRRELIQLDYHIFTKEEFLEMLNQEEENLGKQIQKNSIIYSGFNEYIVLDICGKNL